MTKNEFLSALSERLSGLPEEDVARSLDYYREMIEDGMEDGLSEEQAVSSAGPVDEIASSILSEIPLSTLVKLRVKARRAMGKSEILALALGSPLWFTFAVLALALAITLYAVLWSVVVSLYAVNLSLAASTLAIVFVPILLVKGRFLSALLTLGAVLFVAGLAIFTFFLSKQVTLLMFKLSKKILLAVKASLLKRKEEGK